jgi:hypothetical protein
MVENQCGSSDIIQSTDAKRAVSPEEQEPAARQLLEPTAGRSSARRPAPATSAREKATLLHAAK